MLSKNEWYAHMSRLLAMEHPAPKPLPAFVTGLLCHHCKNVIWSTYRHDMRYCPCGKNYIDGGREYTRCTMEGEMVDIDLINEEVWLGEMQLDWEQVVNRGTSDGQ